MLQMKFKSIIPLLLLVVLSASCEKGELPVKPHDPGDVITASVNMDQDYRWQIYYDLKTNKVVGRELKTSWDLGFETPADGYHVVLNGGRILFSLNTGKNDFNAVVPADTAGKEFDCDKPNGHADSTAIGDWREKKNVYVIDRGTSYWKIQFKEVDAKKYLVRFALLDGTEETSLEIAKDSSYNLSFLSFDEKKQVMVEPPKNSWDMVFTQYTHVFIDPPVPYLVTGCLLNRYNTTAVLDKVRAFADIQASDMDGYNFSPDINTIGYDWKAYTGSEYVVYPKMNYIIRNREGLYYKLHFIDFLEAGVKGVPKWEFQEL